MAVTAATSAETVLEPPGRRRRVMMMIVVGLFVSTFVSDSKHARLPLQFLLKNHLHLGPTAMAAFFGLTSLAWYFKPVAGLLSDVVPLWGSRRRNYLVLSGLMAGGFWALLAVVPRHYAPLLWTLIGANAFAVLASSVAGGLLVEAGQRRGWTGRMGSLRETIIAGTSLAAQPVGGFLVGQAFGWTCGLGAALFLGLIPAAFLLLPKADGGERQGRVTGPEILASLAPVFRSRVLWLAAAFIFLRDLSPGFGTPLFFYQTNVLHFSPSFLGWLGALYNGAAIAGALLYAWLCTRLPLARLLTAGIMLSALGSLLFLGYHSHGSALVIQGVSGLLGIIVSVALMDLAGRAAPVGAEAMSYSLLMSAANLGLTCSDILGSALYEKLHVPFPVLICVSAATTALALFALPFIPRSLLERHDRVGAAPPS